MSICSTPTLINTALYCMFIADALSFPVHWFYNRNDIFRYFGKQGIQTFESAPETHPSSIMNLHSTRSGGRKSSSSTRGYTKNIVGDVILQGKASYWGRANTHYHHAMKAGDNTLNACVARLMMRHLGSEQSYDAKSFFNAYLTFMTKKDSHPDTYAESWHRVWFANHEQGKDVLECGGKTHDTPSVGGLVSVIPLAFFMLSSENVNVDKVKEVCAQHVLYTHPDQHLAEITKTYVELLHDLIQLDANSVEEARKVIYTHAKSSVSSKFCETILEKADLITDDTLVVGGTFSTACYIDHSWPSLLYLAYKYAGDPMKAMLANTNLGGENCHRGSVLGSIVGLTSKKKIEQIEKFFHQLIHAKEIEKEMNQMLKK